MPVSTPSVLRGRFLPTSRADLEARGWNELDILIVTGDAYVDHPAFGPVLDRALPRGARLQGRRSSRSRTGRAPSHSARLGRPRLFVGVSAGNLDSMLNKLTAQKKKRSEDQYSPGGRTELPPQPRDHRLLEALPRGVPGVPVVLGGIEASLRRIAHYDYWTDTVRRSMLLDAKADLLVFGMGERPDLGDRGPARPRRDASRTSATCAAPRSSSTTREMGAASRPIRRAW